MLLRAYRFKWVSVRDSKFEANFVDYTTKKKLYLGTFDSADAAAVALANKNFEMHGTCSPLSPGISRTAL